MTTGRAVMVLLLLGSAPQFAHGEKKSDPFKNYRPFSDFGKDIPGYQAPTKIYHAGEEPAPTPRPAARHGYAAAPPADDGNALFIPRDPTVGEGVDGPTTGDPGPEIAKANFQMIVETFLAKEDRDGCWPVKEGGKRFCFRFSSWDEKPKAVGNGLYEGAILLHDDSRRVAHTLFFTADFSGTEWGVLRVRSHDRKTLVYQRPKEDPPAPTR